MRAGPAVIYALLVAALLVQPHVLQRHVWVVSPEVTQTLVSVLVLLLAALTYVAFDADVRRVRRRYRGRLAASFRYIGVANRHVPLLQDVTSGLLRQPLRTRAQRRAAFRALLQVATVSCARVPWGVLRVVERASGRTEAEYVTGPSEAVALPGNRELLAGERADAGSLVFASGDASAPYAVFLVLPSIPLSHRVEVLLRAIVDQAALLHGYLRASSPTEGSGVARPLRDDAQQRR